MILILSDVYRKMLRFPDREKIRVEDDGVGLQERDSAIGFGLYSVREQLRHLYGGRSRMEITARRGGGTIVTLTWLVGEVEDSA